MTIRKSLTYLHNKFRKQLLNATLSQHVVNGIRKCNVHNYSDSDVPNTSVTDMRKILRLHGYSVEDGYACLLTKCPICKSVNNDLGQAYINKTTGFFLCSSCDYSGQWSALEKIIKKPGDLINMQSSNSIKKTNDRFLDIWEEIISYTNIFSTMSDDHIQGVLEKFDLPIIPEPSKILSNIRLSLDENSLYFPLQNLGNKNVGYVQYQQGNTEGSTQPEGECGGIFLLKSGRLSSKEQPLIIVPTIGDALSIVAQKLSGNVVCLPYGLRNLPQQVLPVLERWQKIVIWVGVDGISQVKNLSRKLGESRCLIVRATGSHPTPREAFRNHMDLKSIVASAYPIWHKSITTFKSLRDDVLADLQNIEKVQGIKWKRYPVLNKLLRGHRRGELTVLTGPTGCGKTTFCSEYSLDLAMQGVNTLWGSFEIRNARLVRTMLQQLAGFPIEEDLNRFDEFADIFQSLPLYFLLFHGQQSIKEVMEAVEHASYVHDISHVIIDNVQFMLGVGDEPSKHSERFWRQDAVIAAFRTFATRTNCHVTLVMHPRKERDADDLSTNSIFGSAKASQEADNVLIIQDKRLTAIRGKKYLQIAKNRYCGDLGIMPLEFDKDALSYASKKVKTPNKESDKISATT